MAPTKLKEGTSSVTQNIATECLLRTIFTENIRFCANGFNQWTFVDVWGLIRLVYQNNKSYSLESFCQG